MDIHHRDGRLRKLDPPVEEALLAERLLAKRDGLGIPDRVAGEEGIAVGELLAALPPVVHAEVGVGQVLRVLDLLEEVQVLVPVGGLVHLLQADDVGVETVEQGSDPLELPFQSAHRMPALVEGEPAPVRDVQGDEAAGDHRGKGLRDCRGPSGAATVPVGTMVDSFSFVAGGLSGLEPALLFDLSIVHLLTWVGFLLAVVIIAQMLGEKRNPGNLFAWALAVLLVPVIGVPLYFFFGGRKSRRLVRKKRQLLDALRHRTGEDVPEDQLQHIRRTEGNRCELLPDGPSAFRAILEGIEEAEHSIHIMTYILSEDEAGKPIVEALQRKAREGVEVRLLLDAFGCLGNGGTWLRELRAAGAKTARFMPLLPLHSHTSANLRNHRKIALFDHRKAVTGGQNLDRRFMGPVDGPEVFRDFSVVLEGPVVRPLTFLFLNDWLFASGERLENYKPLFDLHPAPVGDKELEVIESGPEIAADSLYERIIELVQDAQEEITIVTPYFVPDEVLFRSLLVKARSGKRVRLVLPRKSNHPVVDLARYPFLRRLHNGGVEILLYTPGMVHGKLILFDDRVALSGSANFDMRSLFVNFEMGILHTDPNDIAAFRQWTATIIAETTPLTDDHLPEGRGRRFLEDVAHVFSPLL